MLDVSPGLIQTKATPVFLVIKSNFSDKPHRLPKHMHLTYVIVPPPFMVDVDENRDTIGKLSRDIDSTVAADKYK